MVEVWFDGSSVVPTSDLVRKYAAHAAIFQGPDAKIRWVGNEMGFAPYPLWDTESEADARSGISTSLHSDPDGAAWVPVECDVSIRRPDWFWSTKNERNLMTLDQLMEVYYRSVGRGAQLLLNIPADRRGHMPDADFARAREFGDEIRRRFDKSVAETSANGVRIELPISKAGAPADHVILEEDCRSGQRVRAFRLEGLAGGGWNEIYSWSPIGHKRIVPFASQPLTALRLVVTESAGEPRLRRFAAFHTGAIAPAAWNEPARAGADDEAGRWQDGKFEIDLTSNIKDAAQYRVRFMPENGRVTGISQVQLLLGGASAPHLVKPDPSSPNAFILTMTEIGQKVVLAGRSRALKAASFFSKRTTPSHRRCKDRRSPRRAEHHNSESSNFAASHVIGNIFSRLRTAASAEKQSAAAHDISIRNKTWCYPALCCKRNRPAPIARRPPR